MMRTILTLILLAVIGYGGWYAYQHFIAGGAQGAGGMGDMANFAMPVEGTTLQPEKLAITLNATGTVAADAGAVLKAEIAGRVERIMFEEGANVSSGAPLFEIDARSARANYEQAQASAALARQNLQRMQPLAGSGAIAATEYDQFVGNEKIATANERAAAVALDKATVHAPFSGRVGIRRVSLGDYVQPGQELVMISRASDVRIEFTVPEQQASLISSGQDISFTTELAPGETFSGTITATEPAIDMGGRQLRVLATAQNPDGKLRPGGFVNVTATIAEKPDALMVPEGALVPMGDQQMIMVVGPDGAVQPRPVKLGLRQAGKVEILEGVSAGESVVTAGQMKLMPGAKAQIIPAPGSAPAAAAETQPAEQPVIAMPESESNSVPTDMQPVVPDTEVAVEPPAAEETAP